jgi:hypothetical protein
VHALKVPTHVLRADAGRDAVAEVGDPALGALALAAGEEAGAHALDLGLDAVPAAVEADGVGVALKGDIAALGRGEGLLRGRAPVDGEDVKRARLGAEGERRGGALGKENDRRRRQAERGELLAVDLGDLDERRECKRLEVVGRELAGPRVENLDDLEESQRNKSAGVSRGPTRGQPNRGPIDAPERRP